jgi:hypothetical protein
VVGVTGFDLAQIDELLTTTKAVSKRLDLSRAFYTGTGFARAPRLPVERITYLDRWERPIGGRASRS